jgi:hypothetical protein
VGHGDYEGEEIMEYSEATRVIHLMGSEPSKVASEWGKAHPHREIISVSHFLMSPQGGYGNAVWSVLITYREFQDKDGEVIRKPR